jgi:molybdenum cofactor cytidylyltransferase
MILAFSWTWIRRRITNSFWELDSNRHERELYMISAVVLAAGQSKRMGRPKMTLPWGETTVIGQVVSILVQSGLEQIVVVTGGASQEVEAALSGLPVTLVRNPRYSEEEMTCSLQVGLLNLEPTRVEAALIALGDQPQLKAGVVRAVLDEYRISRAPLVAPSYQMRRGHPWILDRSLWPAVLALRPGETIRKLMQTFPEKIHYVLVDTPSILQDLDTPEDYMAYRPDRAENR